MRKVILVDDEMFARRGLVGLIPWENYGFEVAGEAEDGEEALALIEQVQPDVVITDIRMPVLDGLELIQAVQARGGKPIRFIIISGYGDFKYAQQAVRFGVQDYLLKPIDENELIESLAKLGEQMRREQPRSEAADTLIHASLFEKLLSGWTDAESLLLAANALGLPEQGPMRYFSVEWNDMTEEAGEAERLERIERTKRSIARVLQRRSSLGAPYIHLKGEFEWGMLLPTGDGVHEAEAIADDLARACRGDNAPAVPKVYVGEAVTELSQARKSYLSAIEAMKHKYALAEKNVFVHDHLRKCPLYYQEIDNGLHAELLEQLEEFDVPAMKTTVARIFQLFREKGFADDSIRGAMSRCVHGASRIVQNMQGDEKKLATLNAMLEWKKQPRTMHGLEHLLIAFLIECAGYISELRSTIGKGDIGKIKAYIDNHFHENISLKSIAQRYYMNSVYLGQLFKKTYGVYFNDYLLQLRIREAKRQLRQTDKKVYEIAASVGFGNADYFVTQFEKVERKTPTEYKHAMLEKI